MEKLQKTPINIVSSFVGVLRQYFGTPERMTMDESMYLWMEDQKKSQVWISQEFNDNSDIVGKRPSILVTYPQAQISRQVIGDMMSYDFGGEVVNFDLVQGQIAFKCISSSALSSIELATEVRYFLSVFKDQIQKDYCIDNVRVSGFSAPQRIEEYKEYWTSQVFCDIVYQEKWGVVIEHLRVKSINIDLQTK